MAWRIAFVGFRHGHIFALHNLLKERGDVEVVAACEEDGPTRTALAGKGIEITHSSYDAMLREVDCDIVACGDYFGARGERLIAAMERGRHVIGDKPLCTRLGELERIETLATQEGLRVGCMLDLRDSAMLQTARRLICAGAIGDVQTIHFNAQHPLLYGTRPMWYFEDGKHGGSLNDIAIHAVDCIPWLTGQGIAEITAARCWNAKAKEHPEFQDGAMLMMRLMNGCGVMGDVSYLGPDKVGYAWPAYWRMSFSGTDGWLETAYNAASVTLYRNDAEQAEEVPMDPPRPGGYFDDFLADLEDRPNADGLDTTTVLRSSRIALLAQQAADTARFPVPV